MKGMFDIEVISSLDCTYYIEGTMNKMETTDIKFNTFNQDFFEVIRSNYRMLIEQFDVVYESHVSSDYSRHKEDDVEWYEITLRDVAKEDTDSIISLLHSWLGIHEEHMIEDQPAVGNAELALYQWK